MREKRSWAKGKQHPYPYRTRTLRHARQRQRALGLTARQWRAPLKTARYVPGEAGGFTTEGVGTFFFFVNTVLSSHVLVVAQEKTGASAETRATRLLVMTTVSSCEAGAASE